jgi:hypothetical protein
MRRLGDRKLRRLRAALDMPEIISARAGKDRRCRHVYQLDMPGDAVIDYYLADGTLQDVHLERSLERAQARYSFRMEVPIGLEEWGRRVRAADLAGQTPP